MVTQAPEVRGIQLDSETRCQHFRGPTDIVAIRMKCCSVYYACKDCHQALADHALTVWPKAQWEEKAILCGSCRTELTISQYMESSFRCPACQAQFNPRCQNHYLDYFEGKSRTEGER